jgi:hypothetical protein
LHQLITVRIPAPKIRKQTGRQQITRKPRAKTHRDSTLISPAFGFDLLFVTQTDSLDSFKGLSPEFSISLGRPLDSSSPLCVFCT